MAPNDMAGVPDKVWYFAYGSNMKAAVMARRGIKPLAVQRLVVPSHVLTFDIFGVPYSEPAMASIAERETAAQGSGRGTARSSSVRYAESSWPPPVHGIGYLLPASEFRTLVVSEGAGTAYLEIEVQARPLDGTGGESESDNNNNDSLTVRTLVGRYPFRPNPLPSARYLVSRLQLAAGPKETKRTFPN